MSSSRFRFMPGYEANLKSESAGSAESHQERSACAVPKIRHESEAAKTMDAAEPSLLRLRLSVRIWVRRGSDTRTAGRPRSHQTRPSLGTNVIRESAEMN